MRKAITVQFNWVFVLIAGALILLFFGSIVMKQKSLSELSASQDIVIKLGEKLGVSMTELGKSEVMDFQGKELRITCHDLSSGKATQSLADPVFSPEKVKGERLITLTKGFYMPFHVTNFLYVTSSSVRYIIVYDPDSEGSEELARNITQDLGDKLNPELIRKNEIGNVKDLGNYKTKIVFVKTPAQEVNLKGDVKAVQILDNNELKFFTTKNMMDEGESIYLPGKYNETILGAIFAEDKEAYECSLKKAIKKLNMLSELYKERAEELNGIPDLDSDCYSYYGSAISLISYLKDISLALLTNLNQPDVLDQLKNRANELETENINLIMASCPEIY